MVVDLAIGAFVAAEMIAVPAGNEIRVVGGRVGNAGAPIALELVDGPAVAAKVSAFSGLAGEPFAFIFLDRSR